jgi:CheY-like chemotaxis protein
MPSALLTPRPMPDRRLPIVLGGTVVALALPLFVGTALDQRGNGSLITDFVEKPQEPISREAIIGIYYVREGERLRREIEHLIHHEVTGAGGEFQLTDALDRMREFPFDVVVCDVNLPDRDGGGGVGHEALVAHTDV